MKNLWLAVLLVVVSLRVYAQAISTNQVINFTQGLTNDLTQVQPDRSDPSKALGTPQNSDLTTSNINFVSLGFGGSIVLKLAQEVYPTPNSFLRISETTFNYQCSVYPETAELWLSKDGISYSWLGETCGNNNTTFQLFGVIDTINFIKVVDVSPVSRFSNFHGVDAYDLDGIEIYQISPLAIEIKNFSVKWNGFNIFVLVETASETNTWKIEVESSSDGINFDPILDFIGAGWSSTSRKYEKSISFKPASSLTYFRIKETTLNGEVSYYSTISVETPTRDLINSSSYDLSGRQINSNLFSIQNNH